MLTPEQNDRAVRKVLLHCNYLQSNEGNIDPHHVAFLHAQPGTEAFDADLSPRMTTEPTSYGVRITTVRSLHRRTRIRPAQQLHHAELVLVHIDAVAAGGDPQHVLRPPSDGIVDDFITGSAIVTAGALR